MLQVTSMVPRLAVWQLSVLTSSLSPRAGMNESRLTPGPGEEPALSPQDYNLQQSNLALLRAELKVTPLSTSCP